ncbi:HpcH/HpaI aldolase family protein [Corynebacterium crudilactis]|uniref:HpcH/HpaI aldolase/citrate lyase domain-containing protein n=1 Tax=Corynebacterium crudilactis TaxID=1652495 RepID=A0A172QVC3_9CORY|nr:aldolase/citrate lyase family protein [Corynebacterium crudilactis]ANE04649.1 hypothetical protein ccrud_10825 [Corynebacterium crudilactis]
MILNKSLRQKIKNGQQVTGVLIRIPNEELVEIAACSGFDFILIDGEHGANDAVALRQHIASAAIFGVETLVRVGAGDQSSVLRATDAGAAGIVIPHVDSAEEAEQAVQWSKYRPTGNRGFALYSRAASYGKISAAEHIRQTAESMLLFVMLESPTAASRSAEILGVNGVDGFMIGTSDLGASTEPSDPSVSESVQTIHNNGLSTDALRMDIVNNFEQAKNSRENGANVVVYNTTAVLMDLFNKLK